MTVYTVTTLHDPNAITLPGGGPGSTIPQDINNADQIVGSYAVIWSSPMMVQGHGFLYNRNDGSYTTIDDPLAGQIGGFGGTSARGINDGGQIVGSYTGGFPGGGVHGFLYSGGTYTTLDAPGTTNQTAAYGINNTGQIVGSYEVGSVNHGFVYDGTTYTTLDDPLAGPDGTFAYGINNAGQIVGSYITSGGFPHGFLYSGGTYTTIDNPAGMGTVANGINDLGQIVGYYVPAAGGEPRGFLYSAGAYITLDALTFSGINNSGVLVGRLRNGEGIVAVPGPNPAPPANTSADMILRGANASSVPGLYQIYDIGNNAMLASYSLAQVGTDFGFVTLGGFNDGDTSDMVLRNVNSGAFEVYDIANNQITGAAPLGAVGLDWQLGGFAGLSPIGSSNAMGSSDTSTAQLVQAMAGFGGSSGAADGLNAGLNADPSQQPLLTTAQHG